MATHKRRSSTRRTAGFFTRVAACDTRSVKQRRTAPTAHEAVASSRARLWMVSGAYRCGILLRAAVQSPTALGEAADCARACPLKTPHHFYGWR